MSDQRHRLENLSEQQRQLLSLRLQQRGPASPPPATSIRAEKQLVAYLTARQQPPPAADELRTFLKQSLPDYMVPATFICLDTLPQMPNGKVDRRALTTLPVAPAQGEAAVLGPQDEWESKLAAIWQATLPVTAIGRHDNFFDLGGHSLLAIQLVAHLEEAFGRKLPLATLFQAPTIARLAAVLREDAAPTRWSSLVPIQPSGSKPPLFIIHGGSGEVFFLQKLIQYLGPDQPLFGLQRRELSGQFDRQNSIAEMATHYLAEVRTFQPEGPYYVGGFCIGGTIAFEMAQQLRAQGQQTNLLALIGAGYPPGAKRSRRHYLQRSAYHLQNGNFGFFKPYWHRVKGKLSRKLRERTSRSSSAPPVEATAWVSDVMLKAAYQPEIYPGRLTLIETSSLTVPPWSRLSTEAIDKCIIGGSHVTMFEEPYVQLVAAKLKAGLG